MDLICLFERVGTLSFSMKLWREEDCVPLAAWQPPHTVEIGELSGWVCDRWWGDVSMMLEKLVARSPGPRALSFNCGIRWQDVCTTGRFLRDVGVHVRHLTLRFTQLKLEPSLTTSQVTETFSLDGLSHLEDVHFVVLLKDFKDNMEQGWLCSRMCADILSTAASLHTFTTVSLTIEVKNDKPAALSERAIDWAHLNESMRGLSQLRRVSVLFRCPVWCHQATAADERALQIAREGLSVAASKEIFTVKLKYACHDLLV
ncbi:hypothetical protein L226DRAFT_560042 [Lentinus tigrinus ALCF2SS1-7]|uniref:uncharacterized protein n=1 Tax=Lentinus tigrinus ALCF2SS1-7 TaxID=1328758 RepID=UPI001166243F|nr:hypothetical protein L226DRAFT_560042 [Lentinus tigrinus ALCF2SS1-7]